MDASISNVSMLGALSWVDILLAVIVTASVIVGLWRGLVFEVLSLLGYVAAFIAAQVFGNEVAAVLPFGPVGSALNHGVGIAATFLLALVLWGLMARFIRALIRATPLSAIDRLLGAVFGVLRAAVILLIVTTVVLMTPAGRSPAWQKSMIGPQATAWLMRLKTYLPIDVVKHLPGDVGTRS